MLHNVIRGTVYCIATDSCKRSGILNRTFLFLSKPTARDVESFCRELP